MATQTGRRFARRGERLIRMADSLADMQIAADRDSLPDVAVALHKAAVLLHKAGNEYLN